MTVELNEYKKRFSTMTSPTRGLGPTATFGAPLTRGINDVNFQFEFPKFGLSGTSSSVQDKANPPSAPASKQSSRDQLSPTEKPRADSARTNSSAQLNGDLSTFAAGLFSPPLTNQNVANVSRASSDSHFSIAGPVSTSSPSASSNSNMGASSSCGTSPEPLTQSPMGFKPLDTLTTIGEEQSSFNGSMAGRNTAFYRPSIMFLTPHPARCCS